MQKSYLFISVLCTWPLFSCAEQASPNNGSFSSSPLVMSSKDKKPNDKDYVGLPIKKAQELASKHKIRHRVICIDGKYLPVTKDYRPNRLNFTITKGVVAKVTRG